MNLERAALRSQIAIEERNLREAKIEAGLLRTVLREKLGAWIDIEDIEVDKVQLACTRLCGAITRARESQARTKTLEEGLNG